MGVVCYPAALVFFTKLIGKDKNTPMRISFRKPQSRVEAEAQRPSRRPRPVRLAVAGALALALGLGVAACGSSSSDSGGPINLVAYSTPETVYDKELIPAFQKTSQGERGHVLDLVRAVG